MKKFFSLALALVLCASLAAPVLAAEGADNGQDTGERIAQNEETFESGNALTASLVTASPAPSFADVPAGHTFYDAIAYCAEQGIVGGYDDGTFRPSGTVTRSNFTVMLSRAFYAGYVEKYSRPEYISSGPFWANYQAMLANQALKNTSFENSIDTASAMSQGISRYDMAQLMTNIMDRQGFSASESEKNDALSKISDYSGIPSQYRDAVLNVYALGIIGGYADGTFGGEVTMSRGQAAVVIYRMMQYSGSSGNYSAEASAPASDTPAQPVQSVQPDTPVQPAVKTLTNGKPVSDANVKAMLNDLRLKYPEGTSFVNGYSAGSTSTDVRAVARSRPIYNGLYANTITGCDGWAALVSDYIFGQTGFPARKVSISEARPGDIGLTLNADGKIQHVFIITGYPTHNDSAETTEFTITDASTDANGTYHVYWSRTENQWDNPMPGDWTIEIWTRYPD